MQILADETYKSGFEIFRLKYPNVMVSNLYIKPMELTHYKSILNVFESTYYYIPLFFSL
jgi:hypothetical protein